MCVCVRVCVQNRFKNIIVTSKVKRRRHQRGIDSKGILKQSESDEASNIQKATASNSIEKYDINFALLKVRDMSK